MTNNGFPASPMSSPDATSVSADEFRTALSQFATGVAVVTLRDDLDDLATTATSLVAVSIDPPLISVSTDNGSYFSEALERSESWAVTVLSANQRQLAGRFAAAGRPSARLLLSDSEHHRGPRSGALVIDGGLAAWECRTVSRVPAGDHHIVIAEVIAVDYVNPGSSPLIRWHRSYRELHGS